MSVPILRLRLSGYCGSLTDGLTCGVLSGNEEQKMLQDAACSLQAVPILWYRKVKEKKKHVTPPTPLEMTIETTGVPPPKAVHSPTSTMRYEDEKNLFKLQPRTGAKVFASSLFNESDDENEKEGEADEEYYAGIEAVMSVCDTDEGPALEIKAHGLQFSIFQDRYHILDNDPKLDVLSTFFLEVEGQTKGQDFLERTIPLGMIAHASPGGFWDWKNMINISSGNCDCAVKVYGHPPEEKVFGDGKKLLLFDVLHSSVVGNKSVDRDRLIESLNVLLVWNQEQHELESQVVDGNNNKKESKVEELMNNTFCC